MIELVCDTCGKREPTKHLERNRDYDEHVNLHPVGWLGVSTEDIRLPPGLRACSVKCAHDLCDKYPDLLVIVKGPDYWAEDFEGEPIPLCEMLAIIPMPREQDVVWEEPLPKGRCDLRVGNWRSEWSLKTGESVDEDDYYIEKKYLPRLRATDKKLRRAEKASDV